jgi:hypothetical protein
LLVKTCEAALGSPLRPLTPDQVLEKIAKLSKRDAPGLVSSISWLRARAQEDRVPDMPCRDWIAGFFSS